MPRQMKDVTPQAALSGDLDAFAAPAAETDLEPDQAEADPLLAVARRQAIAGYAALRQWYADELDDDQRLALRPYIDELRITARQIDERATATPHPEGAPDRSREPKAAGPLAAEPPAPESASLSDDAPTDAEIERSQAMIAAVLGPEEIAKLDAEALPAEAEIEVIKPVQSGKGGRGWNWPQYADELIAAAHRIPVGEIGRFRAPTAACSRCCSDRAEWGRQPRARRLRARGRGVVRAYSACDLE